MFFYQITFPSVGSFCFNQTDFYFHKKDDRLEFESIKQNHTDTIVELLSEKYLNERSFIFSRLYDTRFILKELYIRFTNLKDRYYSDDRYKYLNPIAALIRENIEFVDLLRSYFQHRFPYIDHLKFGIKREEEAKKLDDLIRNLDLSNENQTMVFHKIPTEDIYDREKILLVSNFTLNRYSKLIYDFRSTITMNYDIVLPFHDKNYDPTLIDCTSARNLPFFSL